MADFSNIEPRPYREWGSKRVMTYVQWSRSYTITHLTHQGRLPPVPGFRKFADVFQMPISLIQRDGSYGRWEWTRFPQLYSSEAPYPLHRAFVPMECQRFPNFLEWRDTVRDVDGLLDVYWISPDHHIAVRRTGQSIILVLAKYFEIYRRMECRPVSTLPRRFSNGSAWRELLANGLLPMDIWQARQWNLSCRRLIMDSLGWMELAWRHLVHVWCCRAKNVLPNHYSRTRLVGVSVLHESPESIELAQDLARLGAPTWLVETKPETSRLERTPSGFHIGSAEYREAIDWMENQAYPKGSPSWNSALRERYQRNLMKSIKEGRYIQTDDYWYPPIKLSIPTTPGPFFVSPPKDASRARDLPLAWELALTMERLDNEDPAGAIRQLSKVLGTQILEVRRDDSPIQEPKWLSGGAFMHLPQVEEFATPNNLLLPTYGEDYPPHARRDQFVPAMDPISDHMDTLDSRSSAIPAASPQYDPEYDEVMNFLMAPAPPDPGSPTPDHSTLWTTPALMERMAPSAPPSLTSRLAPTGFQESDRIPGLLARMSDSLPSRQSASTIPSALSSDKKRLRSESPETSRTRVRELSPEDEEIASADFFPDIDGEIEPIPTEGAPPTFEVRGKGRAAQALWPPGSASFIVRLFPFRFKAKSKEDFEAAIMEKYPKATGYCLLGRGKQRELNLRFKQANPAAGVLENQSGEQATLLHEPLASIGREDLPFQDWSPDAKAAVESKVNKRRITRTSQFRLLPGMKPHLPDFVKTLLGPNSYRDARIAASEHTPHLEEEQRVVFDGAVVHFARGSSYRWMSRYRVEPLSLYTKIQEFRENHPEFTKEKAQFEKDIYIHLCHPLPPYFKLLLPIDGPYREALCDVARRLDPEPYSIRGLGTFSKELFIWSNDREEFEIVLDDLDL